MTEVRFGNLYNFIDSKGCCYRDLRHTKEFCTIFGIDFEKIKKVLHDTGGYCDCEVLLNTSCEISDDTKFPE